MKKNVRIRRVPSAWLIFSVWLCLVAFPVMIFDFSLNYLFDSVETTGKLMIQEELISEAARFESDLKIESFINRNLRDLVERAGDKIPKNNAADLAGLIQAQTGIKASFLFTHSHDCRQLFPPFVSKELQNEAGRISHNLALRLMNHINQEYTLRNNLHWSQSMPEKERQKLKNLAEGFLQKQFGLISVIPIVPEKTSVGVSARFGGLLYFFYQPFYRFVGNKVELECGFLAVIRSIDIPAALVARSAIAAASPDFVRSLESSRYSVKPKEIGLEPASEFSRNRLGLHLSCLAPQSFMAHLAGAGGFYPENLDEILENPPRLKVSVPGTSFEHGLKPYYRLIRNFEVLLLLFSAVLACRFLLFGFEMRAGLSTRAIAGMLAGCALPVAMLIIAYVSHLNVAAKIAGIEANNYLKQKLEIIVGRFNEFQEEYRKMALNISHGIDLQQNIDEIAAFLADKWPEIDAKEIIISPVGGKNHALNNDFLPSDSVSREEISMRSLLTNSLINGMGAIENYNHEGVQALGTDLFKEPFYVDPFFINNILIGRGRLSKIDQIKTLSTYSNIPVFVGKSKRFAGLISFRFNQAHLLQEFLKRHSRQLIAEIPDIGFYSFASAEEDAQLVAHNQPLTERLKTEIRQAQKTGNTVFWSETRGNARVAAGASVVANFPLAVIIKKEQISDQTGWPIGGAIAVYIILLLVFTNLYMRQEYLVPLASLASAAEAAGQGNFNQQLEFSAEGELQALRDSFAEMLEGLKLKEKMADFVSRDVIEQVEVVEKLETGGEKVAATVAFVDFPDLQNLFKEGREIELPAFLDKTVALADKMALQFSGSLDKVIGSTLMLVFREKKDGKNHAQNACAALLQLEKELSLHNIRTKCGTASGIVVSGRIGDEAGRLDLTVIGDTVNLAARLKALKIEEPQTGIVVAPSTIRCLKGLAKVRFISKMPVKGKSRHFPIYELLGLRS